jgi:hypothetical protein
VSESGTAWIAKNYEKVAQYEGKYIAVNSQIVASAQTSGEVMKIVAATTEFTSGYYESAK